MDTMMMEGKVCKVLVWKCDAGLLQVEVGCDALIKDLVEKLSEGSSVKQLRYVHRDMQGRVVRTVALDPNDMVRDYAMDKELDIGDEDVVVCEVVQSFEQCNLWLVDPDSSIGVFFNPYIRMALGLSVWTLQVYPATGATVTELTELLIDCLNIRSTAHRFALYGNYRSHVSIVEGDEQVHSLIAQEDPQQTKFLQLMVRHDREQQENLGVSRKSLLRIRQGLFSSEYWCTLQGTSFYYAKPDKRTIRNVIKDIGQCQIVYRGGNKSRTQYCFDIVELDGTVHRCKAPAKARVERWITCLRRCHASVQVNEPMTMDIIAKMTAPCTPPPHIGVLITKEHRGLEAEKESLIEARLRKVEVGAEILGKRRRLRASESYAWVDNVRLFMIEVLRCNFPSYVEIIVPEMDSLIRLLKTFVEVAEGGGEFPLSPAIGKDMLTSIMDSVRCLHTLYQDSEKMLSQTSTTFMDSVEYQEQRIVLGSLREALKKPIMQIRLDKVPVRKATKAAKESKWHVLDWWERVLGMRKSTKIPTSELAAMSLKPNDDQNGINANTPLSPLESPHYSEYSGHVTTNMATPRHPVYNSDYKPLQRNSYSERYQVKTLIDETKGRRAPYCEARPAPTTPLQHVHQPRSTSSSSGPASPTRRGSMVEVDPILLEALMKDHRFADLIVPCDSGVASAPSTTGRLACGICLGRFQGDATLVRSKQGIYHEACLNCADCGCSVQGDSFSLHAGLVYCSKQCQLKSPKSPGKSLRSTRKAISPRISTP